MLQEKQIIPDYSLKNHNTFGVDVHCKYFVAPESLRFLKEILKSKITKENKLLILGGGSNILFTGDFDGLVVHPCLKGNNIVYQTTDYAEVEVSAGVNWSSFVAYCIEQGLGGLENLILIPGNAGAAPIQNIGAYGVEQKDCFKELKSLDLSTREIVNFSKKACQFDYRQSIFKKEKGKYIILSVIYRLQKKPKINIEYKVLREYLRNKGVTNPGIMDVADAVKTIRQSKLPDHEVLGNAGSFFKNAVISREKFLYMQKNHPDIPYFEMNDCRFKIPTAWMIEKCGWKGKRMGKAGVHDKQALVLVNYGGASGTAILDLAKMIEQSVYKTFGIRIEKEVNVL